MVIYMLEDYANVAKAFECRMGEVRETLSSFTDDHLLTNSTANQISLSKKRCICQKFQDRIEIPNLKRITSCEVSQCGIKEVRVQGNEMISVHYCLEIRYIDNCCCEKVAVKNGYVLFVDLPICFRPDNFVVFIPNQLRIKTFCDYVIAVGTVRLSLKHNCHQRCNCNRCTRCNRNCNHYNQEWSEWSQHSKPC